MGFKKKMMTVLGTSALGLALLSGGTYAYFNDVVVTDHTLTAGTLELGVENDDGTEVNIDVDNLKPGDTIYRDFEIHNRGTLDIKNVLLDTTYTVNDAAGDNTEDFAEHILVRTFFNMDQFHEIVFQSTLAEMKEMTPQAVADEMFGDDYVFETDAAHDLVVELEFVDNDEDQNQFQGDSIELEWTFTAEQTPGSNK